MPKSNKQYVLIDLERTIGTGCVHFWKQTKFGYTTVPSEAGKFEPKDATETCLHDRDGNTIAVGEDQFKKILQKYGEIE